MAECSKGQSHHVIKNGAGAEKPQRQCKACGYQLTRTTPRGKPLVTKLNAVLWYVSGMSRNRAAYLWRVSAPAVLHWIRAFACEHYEKPDPTGKTIRLELDEMWHSLKTQRHKLWIWKALDRDTGQLLDWECGRRDKVTLKKMVDRLAQWDVQLYGTAKWATYAAVIPKDKLVQSKVTTHAIERHHCRQRHWCGRFKRKSIIISKSQEMVDLTMALFAKFWVNGNQDALLSLLT